MALMRMTSGNIPRQLAAYAVPLVLGNLFQLTYNVVDSAIVGRFIGKEALAAVGTASPVMNLLILGVSGLCIGASVIMSEAFGARDDGKVRREMATVSVFGFWFSAVCAALGTLLAVPLLRLLQTPDEVLGLTASYLRVVFWGTPFTFFYNAVASALKSVGDSKTPLKFLAFASVLNACLDLVFIGLLGFGVICSAATTVIAEAVSAILCIVYVYKNIPVLALEPREFRMDRPLLGLTLRYGGVTALQQACQPVGKLFIQGAINSLGVDAMAAFNAVTRVDDYAFTPEQSIASAITTFTAQNRGAGETKRMFRGFRVGLALETGYWVCVCAATLALREPLMHLFIGASEPEVTAAGCEYLGVMAFLYLMPAFTNGIQGFFRGAGDMGVTLWNTFLQISLRAVFVWVLTPRVGLVGAAWACAVGWGAMLAFQIPYYFVRRRVYAARAQSKEHA